MIVEENFINKYKQQFYVHDISIQKLVKEQKQLLKILEDLNSKTQNYFDKVCAQADRKVKSHRTSVSKENVTKLPLLVAEAELKNNKTYRQLLENEKNNLEKRMAVSMNLKVKDMNSEIKMEKEKVNNLIKNNKADQYEIKKLGQKLVHEGKSLGEIFEELILEVKARKVENEHKQAAIEAIITKTENLKQKSNQLEYLIEQKTGDFQQDSEQQQQNSQKLVSKLNSLEGTRDIMRKNVESVKHRLSQEYYCKLKQLDAMKKKGEELDRDILNLQLKVDEKSKEINNRKVVD